MTNRAKRKRILRRLELARLIDMVSGEWFILPRQAGMTIYKRGR